MFRLTILLPLLFSACASQLAQPSRTVEVVTSLPAGEAAGYKYLGDVVTSEPSEFTGDEDDAMERLRNSAARDGADLVLLQEQGREPCEVNPQRQCVYLRGKKYQKAKDGKK